MVRIPVRRQWDSRPNTPGEVDWGRRITENLEFFAALGDDDLLFSVSETTPIQNGVVNSVVTPNGRARQFDGNGNIQIPIYDGIKQSGTFTWGCGYYKAGPADAYARLFERTANNATNPWVNYGLELNSAGAGQDTINVIVYLANGSRDSFQLSGIVDGYNTIIATISGTDFTVNLNGVLNAYTLSAVPGNYETNSDLFFNGGSPTSNSNIGGSILWGGVWQRSFTDDELLAVGDNVWMVYKSRTVWIPAAGTAAALESNITGVATTSADLTTAISLVTSANVQATVAADLTTQINLVTSANAQAIVAADLTTSIDLVAALNITGLIAAELNTSIPLAATASGTMTIVAELSVGVTTALAANISGGASALADLTTGISLASAITGQATVAPMLTTGIILVTNLNAQASIAVDMSTGIALSSAVIGQCGTVADLTTGISLVSAINAQATMLADLFTGGGVGTVRNPNIQIISAQRRIRL